MDKRPSVPLYATCHTNSSFCYVACQYRHSQHFPSTGQFNFCINYLACLSKTLLKSKPSHITGNLPMPSRYWDGYRLRWYRMGWCHLHYGFSKEWVTIADNAMDYLIQRIKTHSRKTITYCRQLQKDPLNPIITRDVH